MVGRGDDYFAAAQHFPNKPFNALEAPVPEPPTAKLLAADCPAALLVVSRRDIWTRVHDSTAIR